LVDLFEYMMMHGLTNPISGYIVHKALSALPCTIHSSVAATQVNVPLRKYV